MRLSDADLWALGTDALGLLNAFAAYRLTGRYSARELEIYADRLRGVTA